MVLNYIFIAFFLIAFVVAVVRLVSYYFREDLNALFGWNWVYEKENAEVFNAIIDSTFNMAETSITIIVYLIGVMTLWLGIMKIGENGGAVRALSKIVGPFFSKLFPELPKNHPAGGAMLMNFSANMLGLDNAATPLGLKAMDELQKANPDKKTASNAQIMFLVLNTSGLTVIPISVIAIRAAQGAANPADVFLPILLATYFASLAGLIAVAVYQKINLFNKTILGYIGLLTAFIIGIIWYFSSLPREELSVVSTITANIILFTIIAGFIALALRRKINVYSSFIEGAKDGFNVAVKIIPYLVAMLVAIGVFRASGALDMLVEGIRYLFIGLDYVIPFITINTEFVDALPTAFMKPLSGSGARGMMIEAMDTFGADSFVGRLASTFQGSTETTFYTLAVYYGAVNIRNTRYTVVCGLIADFAGIIAAILISYLFFH